MPSTIYQFQKLDLQGLKALLDWASMEGWNPGPQDAEVFWNTDPDGFYGYFEQGNLIAGGAIVSYNGEFGFMGLFIVKPEFRGRGIGRKLWHQRRDMLLQRLHPGASIGMDGVVRMQPFYHKGGFDIAFKDERYECIGKPFEVDPAISSIGTEDFNEVVQYDTHCFGFSRPSFLSSWLNLEHGSTFKYHDGGPLKGIAVLRRVETGYKIGPLFADNKAVAEALYRACLNAAIDQPVFIDIPTSNPDAVALVKKYNTKYVFECARMYYGPAPAINLSKVFGITTFELG